MHDFLQQANNHLLYYCFRAEEQCAETPKVDCLKALTPPIVWVSFRYEFSFSHALFWQDNVSTSWKCFSGSELHHTASILQRR